MATTYGQQYIYVSATSAPTTMRYFPWYIVQSMSSSITAVHMWVCPTNLEIDLLGISNNSGTAATLQLYDVTNSTALHTTSTLAPSAGYTLATETFTPISCTAGQRLAFGADHASGATICMGVMRIRPVE